MNPAKLDGERAVRRACAAGDYGGAAKLALETFGPEILGYLHARDHHEPDAAEAFAVFCEDLWRGLPGFAWNASFRTWAYVLARHAYLRVRRDGYRRRAVPLSEVSALHDLAASVRTRTQPHLRTDVKDEVRLLREALDPDDRDLLTLRVDRGLSWTEVATVFVGEVATDADAIEREAARLRKRYERVKDRLRDMVRASAEQE